MFVKIHIKAIFYLKETIVFTIYNQLQLQLDQYNGA